MNVTNIVDILKGTPIWVWILFIFLMKRGVVALNDREMEIKRLFLLPLIFFVWGIFSIISELGFYYLGLFSMLGGIVIGFFLGWWLWLNVPDLKRKEGTNLIIRAGTPLTLVLIIFSFITKFILIFLLGHNLELQNNVNFNILFGLLSGFIDGLFLGGTLNLYIPFLKKEKLDSKD